jgi:hypothetical protein|uniref:DUF5723 domain-containing protein n=1 Tax=candidate division WOR-3 bacterium TaxID=2052148 RepID=A0A7V3PUX1_UNCW3
MSIRLGYGFNRKLGLLLDGSIGYGTWLNNLEQGEEGTSLKPLIYELNLGFKIRTGDRGALIPSIGTGIVELLYLHDINRFYSANFGAGLRGLSAGITVVSI